MQKKEPNAKLIKIQETKAKYRRYLAKKKDFILSSNYYHKALYFTNNFSLEIDIRNMKILYYYCGIFYFSDEQTARDLYKF
ncbi:30811_t:CDS:1, partial [Racocetra persica]